MFQEIKLYPCCLSHMHRFSMPMKVTFVRCLIFTHWTLEYLSHMHGFPMSNNDIFLGCLIFTLWTLEFYTNMYRIVMPYKVTFVSSRIHFGHSNVSPICTDFVWATRPLLWVVWYSHSGHWYLFSHVDGRHEKTRSHAVTQSLTDDISWDCGNFLLVTLNISLYMFDILWRFWSERRCSDGFVETAVGHYFW